MKTPKLFIQTYTDVYYKSRGVYPIKRNIELWEKWFEDLRNTDETVYDYFTDPNDLDKKVELGTTLRRTLDDENKRIVIPFIKDNIINNSEDGHMFMYYLGIVSRMYRMMSGPSTGKAGFDYNYYNERRSFIHRLYTKYSILRKLGSILEGSNETLKYKELLILVKLKKFYCEYMSNLISIARKEDVSDANYETFKNHVDEQKSLFDRIPIQPTDTKEEIFKYSEEYALSQEITRIIKTASSSKDPYRYIEKAGYSKAGFKNTIDMLSELNALSDDTLASLEIIKESSKLKQQKMFHAFNSTIDKLYELIEEKEKFDNISVLEIIERFPGIDQYIDDLWSFAKNRGSNAVTSLLSKKVYPLKRQKELNLNQEYKGMHSINGREVTLDEKKEAVHYILHDLKCSKVYPQIYSEVIRKVVNKNS